jgi:hypothetical protein
MKDFINKIYTCEQEWSASWIVYGLLWAAVIILGSWLSRGSEHADALNIMILSLSTIAFLFTDRQRKNK